MKMTETPQSLDASEIMEGIEETNRKLASVQVIETLNPIQGADRIVVATMKNLGWQCVVKKDEVKVGDMVVYFECDSILPQKPEFEFMRERKFRVKIIKLKKQISEGLIMPISIIPPDIKIEEGMDLTKVLSVIKHDPEGKTERALMAQKKQSPTMKFLMGIRAFRWIYLKLNDKSKGNWPGWIQKSDQCRVQVCLRTLMDHYNEPWYITEKIDGQSMTAFTYNKKVWGIKRLMFGLGSRNLWLKNPDTSRYWYTAKKLQLEDKIKGYVLPIVVQGEHSGAGIQANKYKLEDTDLFVFGVYFNGIRMNLNPMKEFCEKNQLKTVPIVNEDFVPSRDIPKEIVNPSDIVQFLVKMSEGNSKLLERKREGIVFNLCSNPETSFKVINPYFLLEEKDE